MATTLIGLDIGHRSVKAAILSTTLRGFELVGMGEVPFPDPSRDPTSEEVAAALREVTRNAGTSAGVNTCVSGEDASYKTITLPFEDMRQAAKALPFALDEEVPSALSDYVWDDQRVQITLKRESVLFCAFSRKEKIAAFLDAVHTTGLDPRVVTTPALALSSLYRQIIQPSENLEVIMDVGHKTTHFVGVKGGEIVDIRTVVYGGRDVTQHVAKAFGQEFAQAEELKINHGFLEVGELAASTPEQKQLCDALSASVQPLLRELQFTMNLLSIKCGSPVTRICLTGGGARLRYLDLYLWSKTGVTVEGLKLLSDDFNRLPHDFADEDKLAVPLGLATYGMGYKGKLINLRTEEYAYAGEFQYYRRQIIQIAAGIVMVILFALLNVGSSLWALGHESGALETQLAQVTKRVLGKEVGNVKRARAIIDETIGGKVGDEELPIPEIPATALLAEISSRIQSSGVADATLTEFTIKVLRKNINVKIKGTADSIPSVGKIEESLSKYPCFKKITPGQTRQTIGGSKIEFSFEMDVSCEGVKQTEVAAAAANQAQPGAPGETQPEEGEAPQPLEQPQQIPPPGQFVPGQPPVGAPPPPVPSMRPAQPVQQGMAPAQGVPGPAAGRVTDMARPAAGTVRFGEPEQPEEPTE